MITKNNLYAMDDKMNLYKLLTTETYSRWDKTYSCTTYQISEKTFKYAQEIEDGEWITGEVATWPVPTYAELKDFLNHNHVFSVKRLLDANGIDYRETNIIGFFCIGTQEDYEGDVIPFAYKITLNGQVDEEVSLFEEFNIKSSIEEIPKSVLQNLYDSFSQPSNHPHNTEKVKRIVLDDVCDVSSDDLPF